MFGYISSLITYWLPPLVWMTLICPFTNDAVSFSGTSRILIPLLKWFFPEAPDEQIEFLYLVARKVGHFVVYSVLAWLTFRAIRGNSRQRWRGRWVVGSAVMAIGYAIFDEYAQSFIPTRTASIFDVVIDASSVLTMLVVLSLLNRSKD